MGNAMKTRAKKDDIQYGYDSPFPTKLRELLVGHTQDELAKYVKVQRQSVAQWKDGKTKPDIYYLALIADFFKVSTDYLLGREIASTHNASYICSETGLSEKAVKLLIGSCSSGLDLFRGLNRVLESKGSREFFFALNEYFYGEYIIKGANVEQWEREDGGYRDVITLDNMATDREWTCSMYSHKTMALEEYFQRMRSISLIEMQNILSKISEEGSAANGNDNKDEN